jgi:hypothetical protein
VFYQLFAQVSDDEVMGLMKSMVPVESE